MAALAEAPSTRYPVTSLRIISNMVSKFFSFWTGSPLGYIERLCIASVLAAGHQLDVYSYETDIKVPTGAAIRDANEILPQNRAVIHKSGSWAPFADVFRYEGLLQSAGTWIDLDVLVLKPLHEIGDHIVGWQDAYVINNAVLRLPPNSACLQSLVTLCRSEVVVPPQWPARRKILQRLRGMVGAQVPMQELEWGAVGPLALTRLVCDHRLLHKCQPADVFYPVPWQQAHLMFEPDAAPVWDAMTSSTRAIHLWNDRIKGLKSSPPPRGSFIAQMCERYGIDLT
ncbi:MAG: hypothetical protein ACK4TL_18825 [Hyphomicrobiaceae bacterium]